MFRKFFKKSSKSTASPYFSDYVNFTNHEQALGGRDYSTFADKAYIKNVIAYRAISIVAVAASSVPINLFRSIGKEKKRRLLFHPLMNLLNEPNPGMSRVTLIKSLIMYKLISGNAYILRIGDDKPKELHLLRPDRVWVIAGENCIPLGYRYQIGKKKKDYFTNRLTGECEVLHLKNFHPTDDWYGLSPIEAAYYSIEQHNQASLWNQSMLKNGARPSGALVFNSKTGDKLSDEQYMRLREQIK